MARPEVRTMFAMQATALSAQFNDMFGKLRIPPGFTADMTAPDGPSTGGGVQTLQHVRLHSPDSGPTLVMGSLDSGQMKATIRTHTHLVKLAQQRNVTLTLDPRAYSAFVSRVRKFYEGLHFVVALEEAPEAVTVQVRPEVVQASQALQTSSKFGLGFMLGALVGGGLGAAIMFFVLRR